MSGLRAGLRVYAKYGVITSDGGSGKFRLSHSRCLGACVWACLKNPWTDLQAAASASEGSRIQEVFME